jgi:hypothetical protein
MSKAIDSKQSRGYSKRNEHYGTQQASLPESDTAKRIQQTRLRKLFSRSCPAKPRVKPKHKQLTILPFSTLKISPQEGDILKHNGTTKDNERAEGS